MTRISSQLVHVKTDLAAAERGLTLGIERAAERFDSARAAQLFRSFALGMQLGGPEAGARFLREHGAQIALLPAAAQKAFSELLGDAREIAALRNEVKRLSGLQSVEQLLARIPVATS